MNSICPFKKGDWIIATKGPKLLSGGYDHSWQDTPLKVLAITEAHLILLHQKWNTKLIKPIAELEDWGFIIADPRLVEVITK